MCVPHVTIAVLMCAVSTATDLHPLSDAYIKYINSNQTSWKAGRNFPHNTPLKYLKMLLGELTDITDPTLPIIKHDTDLKDLPESFDARTNWPNCPSINEIRDQGSCGSCWAFGAVEAMTDRVCIYSNGTKQFHVSAEDLISCCRNCGRGCDGGFSIMAWYHWKNHGIVSGGNYNTSQGCRSYTIPPCVHHVAEKLEGLKPCHRTTFLTPACSRKCDNNNDIANTNKLYGKQVYTIRGEENIMAEIYRNGSVQASFFVYDDFFTYKSGVYFPVVAKVLGVHSVKIIAWGVENGTKYWQVANSWNSGWGDRGFFKIRRGQDDCSIETKLVIAGEPLLDDVI